MIKGSFGSNITLDSVAGYRIAACYTPGDGFDGNISVTLLDRTAAKTPFKTPVSLGDSGEGQRGDLVFSDSLRTYKFQNIDLRSIEAGVTRNHRYRFLYFKYDKTFGSDSALQISLANNSKEVLSDNALKDAYDVSLLGGNEHMLGFRARMAVSEQNILRFVTLRSENNCVLAKLVQAMEKERNQEPFPAFEVQSSIGSFNIDQPRVNRIFVHESYGSFHLIPPPSLADLHGITVAGISKIISLELNDFSPQNLIDYNNNSDLHNHDDATIQVVTLLMKQDPALQKLKLN